MPVESTKSIYRYRYYQLKTTGPNQTPLILKVFRVGADVPIRSVDGMVLREDGFADLTPGMYSRSSFPALTSEDIGEQLTGADLSRVIEDRLRSAKPEYMEHLNIFFSLSELKSTS